MTMLNKANAVLARTDVRFPAATAVGGETRGDNADTFILYGDELDTDASSDGGESEASQRGSSSAPAAPQRDFRSRPAARPAPPPAPKADTRIRQEEGRLVTDADSAGAMTFASVDGGMMIDLETFMRENAEILDGGVSEIEAETSPRLGGIDTAFAHKRELDADQTIKQVTALLNKDVDQVRVAAEQDVYTTQREIKNARQDCVHAKRALFQLITAARKDKLNRFAHLLEDAVRQEERAMDMQERGCRAVSRSCYVPMLKYEKLYAWQTADMKDAAAKTEAIAARHLDAVAGELAVAKAQDRAKMNTLVKAWELVVGQYTKVLASAHKLVKELAITDKLDHDETLEACRAAGSLIEAIRGILADSIVQVRRSMEPDDAFHALSILRHAISDSERHVKQLLQMSSDRPHFDKARYDELERSLKEANNDASKAAGELALATKALDDAKEKEADLHASGGGLGGVSALVQASRTTAELERNMAGIEARTAASTRLSQVLMTQLKDARIQRVLTRLDEVCTRQSKWLDACTRLDKTCVRAHEFLTRQYAKLHSKERGIKEDRQAHVARLKQTCERREKEAREKVVGIITGTLKDFESVTELAQGQAIQRRFETLGLIDRSGEFYSKLATSTTEADRRQADKIAMMLGRFHTAFADLAAGHDRLSRGLQAYLYTMLIHEATRAHDTTQ